MLEFVPRKYPNDKEDYAGNKWRDFNMCISPKRKSKLKKH